MLSETAIGPRLMASASKVVWLPDHLLSAVIRLGIEAVLFLRVWSIPPFA